MDSLQNLLLPAFHVRGFRLRHMIVSHQMQHAVGDQKSVFPLPGMAESLRLLHDLGNRDHDIAQKRLPALGKRFCQC